MTKKQWIEYNENIIDGTYLDGYQTHMLKTGLRNIRNLLLMMVNTDDEIRFYKGLQLSCDISRLLDDNLTNFD